MSTDKRVKSLILNQLTKEQYNKLSPRDDELYFITDLPPIDVATYDSVGVVQPDGRTVTITEDGILSADTVEGSIATYDKIGLVKPDRNTLKIEDDGTLSVQRVEIEKVEAYKRYTVDPIGGHDVKDTGNQKFATLDFLIDFMRESLKVNAQGTTISVVGDDQELPKNLDFSGIETNGGALTIECGIATSRKLKCTSRFLPPIRIKDTETQIVFDQCTIEFSTPNNNPFGIIEHGNLMLMNTIIRLADGFRVDRLFVLTSGSVLSLDGLITYDGNLVDFVQADNSTLKTYGFSFDVFPREKISHIFNGTRSWWVDENTTGHTTTDNYETAVLRHGSTLYVSQTDYSQFFPTLPPVTKDVTCSIYDKNGLVTI